MTQKSRSAIKTEIPVNIPSGNPAVLTASSLRQVLTDVADSVVFGVDVTAAPFNADPTGVADSTSGIQAAINATGNGGGQVIFPSGTYKISSQLTIGNGSSTGSSTQAGVYLVGAGNVQATGTVLLWGGASTANSMLQINGPMKGWGVSNISFNGNSLSYGALRVFAGSDGQVNHISCNNFTGVSIYLSSLSGSPSGNPNSQFNYFNDLDLFQTSIASTTAIILDGAGTVFSTTNSSFNIFENVDITLPNSSQTMTGIYIRDADSNSFRNTTITGGASVTSAITFDYTGGSGGTWPANNTFWGYDPTGNTALAGEYNNIGSPASTARPNRFYAIYDTNGGLYPQIANTAYVTEFISPGVAKVAQTASIASTNINPIAIYVAGMYRINAYLEMTTPGSVSNTISATFGWVDDSGATQSATTSNIGTSTKSFTTFTQPFRAAIGSNVTYLTTLSGTVGTGSYALYAKLEKMD